MFFPILDRNVTFGLLVALAVAVFVFNEISLDDKGEGCNENRFSDVSRWTQFGSMALFVIGLSMIVWKKTELPVAAIEFNPFGKGDATSKYSMIIVYLVLGLFFGGGIAMTNGVVTGGKGCDGDLQKTAAIGTLIASVLGGAAVCMVNGAKIPKPAGA